MTVFGEDGMVVWTEEDKQEADCVRRMRGVNTDMHAVADYHRNLSAIRSVLIGELVHRFGWSQHDVAAELGISQARVHKILKELDERKQEEVG
jgi:DNA-directed RNA polymerase specialized sigma subunit